MSVSRGAAIPAACSAIWTKPGAIQADARAPAPKVGHADEAFGDLDEVAGIATRGRGVARVDEAAALELEKLLVARSCRNERVHGKMHQRRRFDIGRAVEKCAERLNSVRRAERSAPQRVRRHDSRHTRRVRAVPTPIPGLRRRSSGSRRTSASVSNPRAGSGILRSGTADRTTKAGSPAT